ncbi:hypothetical protein P8H26_02140 [Pseudochrobactrum sp. sp1633]|uniref:hypothetical protein n=1 Tax=Pseudochrobactrum sp. sp1633 TaxID=3036706 RepID=UPI0025A681CD|nr:hypothetical protein [Pseudochrobactrum sp. sp1633]MDM8344187.1 hypothetical protein [Pseudochrobactrum sp. sp1633]HWD12150.1 hypothetical protein [Pseudochrobactrum sp.]
MNNTNQEDLIQKTFKNTSASESKATITHKIAIAIIETEYKKRVAKTLRLKNERLAHEASLLATPTKLTSKRSVKKVKTS